MKHQRLRYPDFLSLEGVKLEKTLDAQPPIMQLDRRPSPQSHCFQTYLLQWTCLVPSVKVCGCTRQLPGVNEWQGVAKKTMCARLLPLNK